MSFSFKDDPFVCPDCRKLGYCIKRSKNSTVAIEKLSDLTDSDIARFVPLKTIVNDASAAFGRKLQHTHDLFHQEEYEQAYYLYACMIEIRNDCDEVIIGLAASLYFLKKFEDAAGVVLKLNHWDNNNFQERFIRLCESRLNTDKIRSADSEIIHSTSQQKVFI
jgi:hypothetical protein